MKRNYFIIVLFIAFFNFHHAFSQNTWHVAPGGTGNGSGWATAAGDLQAVINNAAAGDQVWVKQGAYQRAVGLTFSVKDGVSIYGGFPNTANPAMGDRNPRQYETILNGNQAGVLLAAGGVESITPETIIDGLTIQNGSGTAGAGMMIYNCDATFRNLVVRNNTSPVGLGGGIAISNSNSTFIQVLVHNNTSVLNPGYDGEAGGIRINSGNLKFYNCVVANNHAEGLVGGMMVVTATVHLYNSIIYGNTDGLNPEFFVDRNFDPGVGAVIYASHCILEGSRGSELAYEAPQFTIYGNDLGGNYDVDPLFNADYSVQAASVGVNKGNTQAYLDAVGSIGTDFFNNNRVVDFIDIGLNEHLAVQPERFYVKQGGTGDGSSWANASGNLQLVMDRQFEGREVWVAEGTYYAPMPYFKLRNKVKVYGGFPATGNPGFADRDYEEHPTILTTTAGYIIGNFCTEGSNLSSETILDGFVFTKNEDVSGFMIGIIDSNSNVSYSNLLFTDFDYGTLDIRRTSESTFTNCAFADNILIDDDYFNVTVHSGAKPLFQNCSFTGNYSFHGPGIYVTNNGNPTIDSCLFANNNNGDVVSGIGKTVVVNHSKAVIRNCTFDANGNDASDGGIILIVGTFSEFTEESFIHPVDVVIDRCTFKNNLNTVVWIQGKPGDKTSINNSLFFKNTGPSGVGIKKMIDGDLFVTNCTITENHANYGWAGGMMIYDGVGTDEIRNSIIYNNTTDASFGAEFWTYGPVSFKNTIIGTSGGSANWDAGALNDFDLADMSTDLGGNLDTPPLFVDAANEDYRLMPVSPAVNAGYNNVFNAGMMPDLSLLTTDLVGNDRIQGTAVDMGAFEYQPPLSNDPFEMANTIAVYPNPAEGIVTIRMAGANITTVKLYSVLGKELMASEGEIIDVSGLSKGMYIVKAVTDEGETYSAKIIKR